MHFKTKITLTIAVLMALSLSIFGFFSLHRYQKETVSCK